MQTFKRAALRQILEKREPALPAMAIRFHPGLPHAQLMDRNGGLSDCAGAYLSEWFVLAGHTLAPRRTAPFSFLNAAGDFQNGVAVEKYSFL